MALGAHGWPRHICLACGSANMWTRSTVRTAGHMALGNYTPIFTCARLLLFTYLCLGSSRFVTSVALTTCHLDGRKIIGELITWSVSSMTLRSESVRMNPSGSLKNVLPRQRCVFYGLPLKVKFKESKLRIAFFASVLAARWVKSDGES